MSCLYNFHTQICCRHTAKSGSSVRKRETPQKTVCLSGFLCWLMSHRNTEELRILLQQFVEVCPSNLSPEVSGSKTCLPGVLAIFLKPRGLSLGAKDVHFKTRGYGWQNQGGWTPTVELCLMEARKQHSPEQGSRVNDSCLTYGIPCDSRAPNVAGWVGLEWQPLLYFSFRL